MQFVYFRFLSYFSFTNNRFNFFTPVAEHLVYHNNYNNINFLNTDKVLHSFSQMLTLVSMDNILVSSKTLQVLN